jgi:hypothetical protein
MIFCAKIRGSSGSMSTMSTMNDSTSCLLCFGLPLRMHKNFFRKSTPNRHATGTGPRSHSRYAPESTVTSKRGRKPVVTSERVQLICEMLARGESERAACLRAGIGLNGLECG